MIMDTIRSVPFEPHAPLGGNTHNYEGGNVAAGDGSVRWCDVARTFQDNGSHIGIMVPRGYYTHTGYSGQTTDPYDGQLALWYPDGVSRGWNHQPQIWPVNRQMYGYGSN